MNILNVSLKWFKTNLLKYIFKWHSIEHSLTKTVFSGDGLVPNLFRSSVPVADSPKFVLRTKYFGTYFEKKQYFLIIYQRITFFPLDGTIKLGSCLPKSTLLGQFTMSKMTFLISLWSKLGADSWNRCFFVSFTRYT